MRAAAAYWAPTKHCAEHLQNHSPGRSRKMLLSHFHVEMEETTPWNNIDLPQTPWGGEWQSPPQRHLFDWQSGICVPLAAPASWTTKRLIMLLMREGHPRLVWSQTDYWRLSSCPHPRGCSFTVTAPTHFLARDPKLCLLQQSNSGIGISTMTKTAAAAANTQALLSMCWALS